MYWFRLEMDQSNSSCGVSGSFGAGASFTGFSSVVSATVSSVVSSATGASSVATTSVASVFVRS